MIDVHGCMPRQWSGDQGRREKRRGHVRIHWQICAMRTIYAYNKRICTHNDKRLREMTGNRDEDLDNEYATKDYATLTG